MDGLNIRIDEGEEVLYAKQAHHKSDALVVTKGIWRGVERISIRYYTLTRDGQFVPTQKGVSIPMAQFRSLQAAIAAVVLPGGGCSATKESEDGNEKQDSQ